MYNCLLSPCAATCAANRGTQSPLVYLSAAQTESAEAESGTGKRRRENLLQSQRSNFQNQPESERSTKMSFKTFLYVLLFLAGFAALVAVERVL